MAMLSLFPGLKRLNILCPPRLRGYSAPSNAFFFEDSYLARFIPAHGLNVDAPICLEPDHNANEYQDSICLFPQLEVFRCINASFSGSTLLKLLSSRKSTSLKPSNILPLKKVDVIFRDRQEMSDRLRQKLKKFERKTGTVVVVPSPFVLPSQRYSPYLGISELNDWDPPISDIYFGF
jgi:hypothetical protein